MEIANDQIGTGTDTAIRTIAADQHWVVSAGQAHGTGLSYDEIARRCRAGTWQRLYRGVYLLDPDLYSGGQLPRLTRVAAGVLAAGPRAVASHHSAAELLGLPTFGDERIHVSVPGDAARHQQDDLVVHQMRVPPSEHLHLDGIPCTSVLRTLADTVCTSPRFEAVAVVDSALNQSMLTDGELPTVAAMIRGRPGCVAGRGYLREADGRAQSPAETRVRLVCADGNVAPDVLQHPVRDRGGTLLGYADLAWLAEQLAVEVDGAGPHGLLRALFRDRHRQNDFTTAAWRIVRFTWADTYRPGYVLATVRAALRSPLTSR